MICKYAFMSFLMFITSYSYSMSTSQTSQATSNASIQRYSNFMAQKITHGEYDKTGELLYAAIYMGYWDHALKILTTGSPVVFTNDDGGTPLMAAALSKDPRAALIVQKILDSNIPNSYLNATKSNCHHASALDFAVTKEIFSLLKAKGALSTINISTMSQDEKDYYLHSAQMVGHTELADRLKAAGAKD